MPEAVIGEAVIASGISGPDLRLPLPGEVVMLQGPEPAPLSEDGDIPYNIFLDTNFNVGGGVHNVDSNGREVGVNGIVVKVTEEGRGIMGAGEVLTADHLADVMARGRVGSGGDPGSVDHGFLVSVLVEEYGPDGVISPGLLESRVVDGVETWVITGVFSASEQYGRDGGFFVSYDFIQTAEAVTADRAKEAEAATVAEGITAAPVTPPAAEEKLAAVAVVPSGVKDVETKTPVDAREGLLGLCGASIVPVLIGSAFFYLVIARLGVGSK